jgi:hypothetical protein
MLDPVPGVSIRLATTRSASSRPYTGSWMF